jgi:LysR family transcriptional regulator, hypochlorite-specific transcription factor HypT
MEIKLLEDFLAVASSGNFSRAAEARNVTQPAFSRRLKALEVWMGAPLLDRSSYPITLTPAGEKLLPVAERVVKDIYAAREEARAVRIEAGAVLKLAMPHSLAVDFFPMWWPKVAGDNQQITAKVIAENLHDCVEALLQGNCQFLLCYRSEDIANPVFSNGFQGIAVDRERLLAVMAPSAPASWRNAQPNSKSQPVPYLGYAPDSFLGKVTAHIINESAEGSNLRLTYESAFAEALRAQALAGAGIAWLPLKLINDDLQNNRLVLAGEGMPTANLTIWLYRSTQNAGPLAEAVWQSAIRCSGLDVGQHSHAEVT